MAKSKIPLETRFWNNVDVNHPSGCWLWHGAVAPFGYGRFKIGPRKSPVVQAHRLSWEMRNGPIPNKLHVLHRCDVPACVNPAHLFLGTQSDNNKDMFAKGRGRTGPPPGGRNPNSKLTEDDVLKIRHIRDTQHLPYREIGAMFGVGTETIARIIRRDLWTHI